MYTRIHPRTVPCLGNLLIAGDGAVDPFERVFTLHLWPEDRGRRWRRDYGRLLPFPHESALSVASDTAPERIWIESSSEGLVVAFRLPVESIRCLEPGAYAGRVVAKAVTPPLHETELASFRMVFR